MRSARHDKPRCPMMRFGLAATALALAALLSTSCECGAVPHAAAEPRVRVRELPGARAFAVGRVAGMAGDWVMAGGGLRVLIGGMQRPRSERGRVLALQTVGASASDDFESLAPIVIVGEVRYDVNVVRVERARIGDRAGVRVVGRATLPRGAVELERTYTIADVERTMAIYTRADRDGIAIAERVAWGGEPPFVPFVGRLDDSEWHDASWMGTEGARRAIVIGSRTGKGRVRADRQPHGDHEFLRATELALPIARGRTVRTLLTTSRDGLSAAVRRLGWARGRPFPEASVAVVPRPPRAAVRIVGADGPWLRARVPESGRMQVPLPDDGRELTAHATAYGHIASERAPIAPGMRVRLRIPPSGRLHVRAVDASTGTVMPFRLRVRGAGGTASPELGPIWSAAGAHDVAASAGLPIELPLPLGEYRVVVTRGPEWSIEERAVVVTGARVAELEVPLTRAVDPGDWIACDFHLHASPSPDSHVTLEDRVIALVAEGVRYAVPTDHNHVTDYAPAVLSLGAELGTIPGVEITTWEPAFGHFNAFPFPLDPALPANGAPSFLGLTPSGLFAALRERAPGAIVQVNHPRLEPGIGYFDQVGFDPITGEASGPYSGEFDTLEVWNGFDLARPANTERNLAEWIAMLARGQRVVATGNSDSHTVRTEWAGYPRTYVYVEGGVENPLEPIVASADATATDAGAASLDAGAPLDAAVDAGRALDAAIDGGPDAGREDTQPARVRESDWRLVSALREGRAFVTNGPFVRIEVEGRGPGETVSVPHGRARVTIEVRAPAWIDVSTIDVYVGRSIERTIAVRPRRARSSDLPGLRARESVDVRITEPTFVLAVVRGEATMDALFARRDVRPLAFTNPIWLAPE